MKPFFIFMLSAMTMIGCAQTSSQKQIAKSANAKSVGGPCEGCEAIYESPVPFEKLSPVDTLPDFNEQGPKIKISGTVYQPDGKTPAKDVVVYVYHTDQNGQYSTK